MGELTTRIQTPEKNLETHKPKTESQTKAFENFAISNSDLIASSTPPNITGVAHKLNAVPDGNMRQAIFRSYQQQYGNRFASQIARIIREETPKQTKGFKQTVRRETAEQPSTDADNKAPIADEDSSNNKTSMNNNVSGFDEETRQNIETAIKDAPDVPVSKDSAAVAPTIVDPATTPDTSVAPASPNTATPTATPVVDPNAASSIVPVDAPISSTADPNVKTSAPTSTGVAPTASASPNNESLARGATIPTPPLDIAPPIVAATLAANQNTAMPATDSVQAATPVDVPANGPVGDANKPTPTYLKKVIINDKPPTDQKATDVASSEKPADKPKNNVVVLSSVKNEDFKEKDEHTIEKREAKKFLGLTVVPEKTIETNQHVEIENGEDKTRSVEKAKTNDDGEVVGVNKVVTNQKSGSQTIDTTEAQASWLGAKVKQEKTYNRGFTQDGTTSISKNASTSVKAWGKGDPTQDLKDDKYASTIADVTLVNKEGHLGLYGKKGGQKHIKNTELAAEVKGGVGVEGKVSGGVQLATNKAVAKGDASVRAGLYGDASASMKSDFIQANANASALAGAEAKASGEAGYDLKNKSATLAGQASAFAGAKVEGSISGGLGYKGHNIYTVTAKGQASAGIGASANFTASYKGGTFRIGAGLAATLGIGVGGSTEVEVSPVQAAEAIVQVAYDSNQAAQNYATLLKKSWKDFSWKEKYKVLKESTSKIDTNSVKKYFGIKNW